MRRAALYRVMADDEPGLDFSDAAAEEMFVWESTGKGALGKGLFGGEGPFNGYAVGKRYLDVMLALWKEDIRGGLLFPSELYKDPDLAPHREFIEKQLQGVVLRDAWFVRKPPKEPQKP